MRQSQHSELKLLKMMMAMKTVSHTEDGGWKMALHVSMVNVVRVLPAMVVAGELEGHSCSLYLNV